ncbi:MAG TPA: CO dehydrogenase/acetyl-CoA synthase complex subunit alpha [Candidatus Limnocylindrales bacterium]|nr:CO dehydrogenase/acetyl-CoA synthase complex subunit alpha [Candidatus Limnocylindrales bacterium]
MSSGKMRQDEVRKIIRAEDEWEPVGPTPMPSLTELRNWDMRLLDTYEPFYAPFCDLCCLCTFGKCDLTEGRKGACGIDIAAQQARWILICSLMGTAAHGAHGRHIIDHLIEKHGEDFKIDLGTQVNVEAPIIRTVMGLKPETLADLRKAIEYVEREMIHLVAATHMGQEGSSRDFESKAFHAGMLDHVALEAADIAQIVGYGYPTSIADTPLVDLGWGAMDQEKPCIVVVGHNAITSNAIIDYLRKNDLYDKVEVGGLCCTAHDVTRYSSNAKVIGPLSRQRFFLKAGLADVIVTDEQCVLTDIPIMARESNSALFACSDKICYGLENASEKNVDDILKAVLEEQKQYLILNPEKAAEVIVRTALALAPQRKALKKILNTEEATELAAKCGGTCEACNRACSNLLPVNAAIHQAGQGDFTKLSALFLRCIGCAKCEEACVKNIPILRVMQAAASRETYKMRSGRGPIHDVEIRKVGSPIVLGTIPGVILFAGCSNFPGDIDDVAWLAEELARRKYIVTLSGCAAMAAAMKKDAEGKTIYEKFIPEFDAGCIVNVGSCVANAHVVGAAIKIANIFATLPNRANFELMSDYILNRVGACGVVWGPYSQKALAIGTGAVRWGVPIVLGPHGSKYRRLFISNKEQSDWTVMDGRTKTLVNTEEPTPEHMMVTVETKERALVTIIKQCFRRNDTPPGRAIKLNSYISAYKQVIGTLPDDLQNFVRTEKEIPIVYKREVLAYLKEVGWKPKPVLSLPTIIGTYDTKVPIEATVK